MGFPCGLAAKESACNAGGLGLIPGLGKDPLEKGTGTHSSILAWRIPRGCKEKDIVDLKRTMNQFNIIKIYAIFTQQ